MSLVGIIWCLFCIPVAFTPFSNTLLIINTAVLFLYNVIKLSSCNRKIHHHTMNIIRTLFGENNDFTSAVSKGPQNRQQKKSERHYIEDTSDFYLATPKGFGLLSRSGGWLVSWIIGSNFAFLMLTLHEIHFNLGKGILHVHSEILNTVDLERRSPWKPNHGYCLSSIKDIKASNSLCIFLEQTEIVRNVRKVFKSAWHMCVALTDRRIYASSVSRH